MGMDPLAEALQAPETTTELFIRFSEEGSVLDGRVAALTNLEELKLRDVPPDYVLPEELLALPKLRHLEMSGADDKLVIPRLVPQLKIRSLHLWDCRPGELPDLPHVRALHVPFKDAREDIAELARRFVHLEELHTWDDDATNAELPNELGALVNLVVLSLNSRETKALPETLGRLAKLEKLHVRLGISELPASFAQLTRLADLSLDCNGITSLPIAVTALPALRELEISGQLAQLPPEVANMRALRVLGLRGALNKGAMVSKYDDISKLKPLPKALSELVGLEKLDLRHCGVFDLEPLRPLVNLRELKLDWAGISTIEPLVGMQQLAELSLEHCDRLKDLAPLAKLSSLRELNLENTAPSSLDVLREVRSLKKLNISYIKAKRIDAVYDLDVELEADSEVLEKYNDRAALRALPPVEQIVARIAAVDLATAEPAFGHLATWVAAASTKDTNAITAALGLAPIPVDAEDAEGDGDDDDDDAGDDDDDDEDGDVDDDDLDDEEGEDEGMMHAGGGDDGGDGLGGDTHLGLGDDAATVLERHRGRHFGPGPLPGFDESLARHAGALSSPTLGALAGVLFRSTGDNFAAAVVIAKQIIARGDDAAQAALVDSFSAANEYYDTGHRAHEGNVHDAMIDDLLPQLRAPALAKLLAWCSDGHLDPQYGDGMIQLFVPALERAGAGELATLIKRLEKYAHRVATGSNPADQLAELWRMLGTIKNPDSERAIAEMRLRLEAVLAAAARRARFETDLESEDAARVALALREAVKLPDAELEELQGALWRANECTPLPGDSRRALLVAWKRRDHEYGLAEALGHMMGYVPVAELRADAEVLERDAQSLARLVRIGLRYARKAKIDEAVLAPFLAWATELDGMPAHVAASADIKALFKEAQQNWDSKRFAAAVAELARLDRFEPPPETDKDYESFESRVASIVAHNAESHEWEALKLLAHHLHKLRFQGRELERVLAQLVGVSTLSNDPEAYRALEPLIPGTIEWDILAYNLACRAAVSQDRPAMLKFAERALQLGKSPAQFQSDSDFEPYSDDADLKQLFDKFS